LATGSIDNTAKIWDSVSRELLHILKGYQEDVSALSWSPDGSQIAVASLDSSVDLWDAISGEKLSTFVGLSDQVRDVAWSPAGDYIATDSLDGTIRIWDAVSGKQLYDVFQNNLEEGLLSNSIDWSPGGDRVLIMGVDHNQIWDLTELPPILSGHSSGLNKAQWSPDGMLIATGSLDGTTRIWDAANGDLVANLEHLEAVNDITWSPDSSIIALASQDGSIGVWEIATDSFEEIPNPDGFVFNYLAWSPDGSRFVATSETDLVGVIWDVNTGVSTLLHQGDLLCALTTPSWSPEGDRIITGCERRDVRDTPAVIWDVETGEELGRLGGESGNSLVVRWSPDGSSIAVGYSDIEIRIWDAGTGLTTVKYSGHADPIVDLDWSPNSQRIASADYGGNIRVWDAQTGEVVLSDKQNQTITSISWSPAGDYLIASSYDIVPEILPAWQTTEALLAYAEGCCIWRELSVRERERFGLPKQR
jgi:WD40 repeat protein